MMCPSPSMIGWSIRARIAATSSLGGYTVLIEPRVSRTTGSCDNRRPGTAMNCRRNPGFRARTRPYRR